GVRVRLVDDGMVLADGVGDWRVFFFFFQAEDGIRDRNVTGVQTCALPISRRTTKAPPRPAPRAAPRTWARTTWWETSRSGWRTGSEERRVGKECRARRSPGR